VEGQIRGVPASWRTGLLENGGLYQKVSGHGSDVAVSVPGDRSVVMAIATVQATGLSAVIMQLRLESRSEQVLATI
jgi:hypothetical protein